MRFSLLLLGMLALPLGAQQPRLLPTSRELRIDGAATDLSVVSSLTIGRNGMMVVGQRQDNRLRIFDAQGKESGSIGRKGEGPGEFEMLGLAGWTGDTLWVNDQQLHRTTYVTSAGKLIRTERWEAGLKLAAGDSVPRATVGGIFPQAIYPRGEQLHHLLLNANDRRPKPAWYTGGKGVNPVVRVNRDGVFQRVVAWLPPSAVSQCSETFNIGNHFGVAATPFCAAGMVDIARDGSKVLMVLQHDLPAVAPSATYRVVVMGERGDTLLSREMTYVPVPVTPRQRDSVIAVRAKGADDVIAGAVKKFNVPPTHAPVLATRLGLDGTIWLSLDAGTRGEWLVLDGRGSTLGRVVLPANVTLQQANRTTVWGVEMDSDDLPSIVRYRIGG